MPAEEQRRRMPGCDGKWPITTSIAGPACCCPRPVASWNRRKALRPSPCCESGSRQWRPSPYSSANMTTPLPDVLLPLVAAYHTGEKLLLLFDYDGTLTPIVDHPWQAHLAPQTRELLAELAAQPNVHVGVFSGRRLDELEQLIGLPQLFYCGLSGIETRIDGTLLVHPTARSSVQLIEEIVKRLSAIERVYPGTGSSASVALHSPLSRCRCGPDRRGSQTHSGSLECWVRQLHMRQGEPGRQGASGGRLDQGRCRPSHDRARRRTGVRLLCRRCARRSRGAGCGNLSRWHRPGRRAQCVAAATIHVPDPDTLLGLARRLSTPSRARRWSRNTIIPHRTESVSEANRTSPPTPTRWVMGVGRAESSRPTSGGGGPPASAHPTNERHQPLRVSLPEWPCPAFPRLME